MSARDDGGPAFPVPDPGWLEPRTVAESMRAAAGMSMRDYFAAKALHQFLAGAVLPPGYDASNDLLMLGARAYEVADAMLKARSA